MLSGDKFGELCGVTRGAVSQWETNLTKPTIENLIKLRSNHYFSIDWVLTGDGKMVPDNMPPEGLYITEPRVASIAAALMQAMQEGRGYLIDSTQKNLDASTELIAQAAASANKKDR
jgi:transcriptional regulator with XRE-family HTH domain